MITWQKSVDVEFREAVCFKIDAANKRVYCRSSQDTNLDGKEEFSIDYDYLIIAMGAKSNTFNTPGVEENAHFLKVVIDIFKGVLVSLHLMHHNHSLCMTHQSLP